MNNGTGEGPRTRRKNKRGGVARRVARRRARRAGDRVELTRVAWITVAGLILLILAPTLALPLGPDSSMFFVSAQKVLHEGAVHYRDIVDVKPPLVYHLYAAAMFLLGESVIAVRIVDLLLQLATCALIAGLIRRIGASDAWAAAGAVLYALLYGSLGYAYTMQVESWFGLVLVATAWLALVRRTRIAFVAAGALSGVALMLKFPLAVLLGSVVLGEWLVAAAEPRAALRNSALAFAGFLGVLLPFVLYLVLGNAVDGFFAVGEFITGYARTKPRGPVALASELLGSLPVRTVAALGLVVVVAIIGALVLTVRDAGRATRGSGAPTPLTQWMLLSLGLLTASLVVEGKYYAYQMSRLYAPAAIAAGFAIVGVVSYLWRESRSAFVRIGSVAVAIVAVIFSPIPGWLWFTVAPATTLLARGEAAYDAYFDRMALYYPRSELKRVGAAIDAARVPDDRVLALSSIGALVHYHSGSIPDHRVYHSAFLLAEFAPQEWRDEFRTYALERHPRFIVVQRGDVLTELTGNDRSSDALVAILGIDSLLATGYEPLLETKRFVVYRRMSGSQ